MGVFFGKQERWMAYFLKLENKKRKFEGIPLNGLLTLFNAYLGLSRIIYKRENITDFKGCLGL
jgi:hypothetical protein